MEIISKDHLEWIAIVRSFGGGIYSEDIVQDTYLRIHKAGSKKKIVVNGKVNKAFMWVTLRNNYINFARKNAKMYKVELKDYHMKNRIEHDQKRYIANDVLEYKINEEVKKWHWYDRDLFELITSGEISMRKLARESTISLSSIANTMNKCRRKLREAIGEDYEDYINGDYKQIIDA
jgi:DNA-directed RNA polymerase specialized sigma24 family protein